jgi:hypothetical protein
MWPGLLVAAMLGTLPASADDEPAAPSTDGERAVESAATAPEAVGGAPDYASYDAWLRTEEYAYRGGGRDPFASLVTRGDEGQERAAEQPGVADLILVGLLWGGERRFALVESAQGEGLILEVGDQVRDGRVLSIGADAVVFLQSAHGLTRKVTLPIASAEEGKDER